MSLNCYLVLIFINLLYSAMGVRDSKNFGGRMTTIRTFLELLLFLAFPIENAKMESKCPLPPDCLCTSYVL